MTKVFIFLTFALFSHSVYATETLCTGKAWITSAFMPIPLRRNETISLNPGLSELAGNPNVSLIVDIGGDPITYIGPIDVNGAEEKLTLDPESGDIFSFKLKVLSSKKIKFGAKFLSSDNQVQGTIHSANLKCR